MNNYLRTIRLKESNAQFYVVFGISGLNKRVVEFCKNENKKLVLFFASDEELNLTPSNFLGINTELINYFIANSFLIFCQNQFQQTQLNHLFNKKGHLLLNPIEVNTNFQDKSEDRDKKIVWIGKSNDVKNPNLFISIVKLNPSKKFIMLCSLSDNDLHLKIKSEIHENLKFIENASIDEVDTILKSCHILISTSQKEGFPNVFLQAGKYSIPVISSEINPNGYVTDFECGIITSNQVDDINKSLQIIYNDNTLFKKLAINHYNYVKNFHCKELIIDKFKTTVLEKIA
jgi:glycosyltransferase involved in cell wall biosynthesis